MERKRVDDLREEMRIKRDLEELNREEGKEEKKQGTFEPV